MSKPLSVIDWEPKSQYSRAPVHSIGQIACWLVLLLLPLLEGCNSGLQLRPDGRELAQQLVLVDTHIDAPLFMHRQDRDIAVATEGQFDLPKAKSGGLDVAFMSIFIPSSVAEAGDAAKLADELIELVEQVANKHPAAMAVVRSTEEVRSNFTQNRLSLALGMENGAPIAGDLINLNRYHAKGIRYITLTHSKSNHISDSSYDENRQWNGLSDFGKQLIPAMNDIGMMIDVSHISDEAFFQVIELSRAPVVATHSSVRKFIPGFERNMDDAMIKALAKNGGVIQINFGSGFIHQPSRENGEARTESIRKELAAQGLDVDSDEGRERRTQLFQEWPYEFANMDHLLDHFDHIRDLVGVEHIGFGSDFDGVGDTLPIGIKTVADYPNLIDGLLARGYSEDDVRKIAGENLLRVWAQVEELAARR